MKLFFTLSGKDYKLITIFLRSDESYLNFSEMERQDL